MNTPVFSVIICSIGPLKFAQASECYRALLARDPQEFIGIHDASVSRIGLSICSKLTSFPFHFPY
jgi:hypothetical protein